MSILVRGSAFINYTPASGGSNRKRVTQWDRVLMVSIFPGIVIKGADRDVVTSPTRSFMEKAKQAR